MASPDESQYTSLTLYDQDPYTLLQKALTEASSKLPGWIPRTGSLEVTITEALAVILSEGIYAINRLPDGIAEVLIGNFGIQRLLGAAPEATVTFKVSDATGHEIPAGTIVRLAQNSASQVDFLTNVGLLIPSGQTTGTVPVTALTNTTAANGAAVATQLVVMTSIPFIESAQLATSPSGGADPETADEWRNRAMTLFQSLTSTLVLPQQFTIRALQDPAVHRAFTLDNWNVSQQAVGHVTVAVADVDGEALAGQAMTDLQAAMEPSALAGLSLHVVAPTYTTITVNAALTALPGYVLTEIQARAVDALQEYLSPENWPWDGTVRVNELVVLLGSLEGVDYVGSVTINGAPVDLNLTGNFPLVRSGTHVVAVAAAITAPSSGQTGDPGGGGGNTGGGTGGSGGTPVGGGGGTPATGTTITLDPTEKTNMLAAADQWFGEFVRPDGIVLQKEGDNKSVSEGVPYAMITAVLTNNMQRYDTVVYAADVNMRRGASKNASFNRTTALHLLGWNYNPSSNLLADANFATDAEWDRFGAAWAAWQHWGRNQDKQLALNIANDLIDYATQEDGTLLFQVTDEWQQNRTNGLGYKVFELNISYYRPLFIRKMKKFFTDLGDTVRADKCDRLLDTFYSTLLPAVTGTTGPLGTTSGLPPEWNDWNTQTHTAGALTAGTRGWTYSRDTFYGYNAFRTIPSIYSDLLLNSGESRATTYLQGAIKALFLAEWAAHTTIYADHNHDGTARVGYDSNTYSWAAYEVLTAGDSGNATGAALKTAKLNIAMGSNAFGQYYPTGVGQPSTYYNNWWIWFYHALNSGLWADIENPGGYNPYTLVTSSVDVPPSLAGSVGGGTTGPVTGQPSNWPVPASWVELARDEFNSGLTNWSIYAAEGVDWASDHGFWRAAQVKIAAVSGVNELQLVGQKIGGVPYGGAIQWNGPGNHTAEQLGPVRYEFRMKFDASLGLAGVAQLWPNTNSGWPTHGEIDIVEFGGGGRIGGESNYHLDVTSPSSRHLNLPFSGSIDWTQWHDVAIVWLPGTSLTTIVDGVVKGTTTDTSYIPSTNPMHLVFQQDWLDSNLAHYESTPVIFHVQRVRVLTPAP